MSTFALTAELLCKRFGKVNALDGFSLEVPEGTVCGLLGPNGAGKTTAVRVLSTLIRADSGRATVAGFDVSAQAAQVRYRIGLAGQRSTVDEILTGRENLEMWGRLHHLGPRGASERAGQLLEQFGLTEAADRRAGGYSGGMRRRLDLAAAFMLAPAVMFLDEPTTGLDPASRNEVWRSVRALAAGGTTVLLTTQYLEEADQLAHQIAVIARGRVIADDTPERLKSLVGGDRIDLVLRDARSLSVAASLLERIAGTEPEVDGETGRINIPVTDRTAALLEVISALNQAGIEIEDISLRRPTLDEAFLYLTARPQTEETPA
ncbi:ATP-binding cassette domain-containing protein [Streptomyces glomeratus]|uniref:Daunorubicin resistance protein DrrA family ABC transporter ATP-binding protein n=1 Tax=Streptomyces glomeratus TaxID=284452 RepID=A0ABP6LLR8_9ACTN|nr:ATP-binding cassette domain-containing protein [Streptomyces glomeratus]MCF1512448.1 ATP-binding cassette domain-containing protein [Streptomyces glomeratus]